MTFLRPCWHFKISQSIAKKIVKISKTWSKHHCLPVKMILLGVSILFMQRFRAEDIFFNICPSSQTTIFGPGSRSAPLKILFILPCHLLSLVSCPHWPDCGTYHIPWSLHHLHNKTCWLVTHTTRLESLKRSLEFRQFQNSARILCNNTALP